MKKVEPLGWVARDIMVKTTSESEKGGRRGGGGGGGGGERGLTLDSSSTNLRPSSFYHGLYTPGRLTHLPLAPLCLPLEQSIVDAYARHLKGTHTDKEVARELLTEAFFASPGKLAEIYSERPCSRLVCVALLQMIVYAGGGRAQLIADRALDALVGVLEVPPRKFRGLSHEDAPSAGDLVEILVQLGYNGGHYRSRKSVNIISRPGQGTKMVVIDEEEWRGGGGGVPTVNLIRLFQLVSRAAQRLNLESHEDTADLLAALIRLGRVPAEGIFSRWREQALSAVLQAIAPKDDTTSKVQGKYIDLNYRKQIYLLVVPEVCHQAEHGAVLTSLQQLPVMCLRENNETGRLETNRAQLELLRLLAFEAIVYMLPATPSPSPASSSLPCELNAAVVPDANRKKKQPKTDLAPAAAAVVTTVGRDISKYFSPTEPSGDRKVSHSYVENISKPLTSTAWMTQALRVIGDGALLPGRLGIQVVHAMSNATALVLSQASRTDRDGESPTTTGADAGVGLVKEEEGGKKNAAGGMVPQLRGDVWRLNTVLALLLCLYETVEQMRSGYEELGEDMHVFLESLLGWAKHHKVKDEAVWLHARVITLNIRNVARQSEGILMDLDEVDLAAAEAAELCKQNIDLTQEADDPYPKRTRP